MVNESSSDLTVTEGENATLKCSAIGYPEPNITWRREDYQPIYLNQSNRINDLFIRIRQGPINCQF